MQRSSEREVEVSEGSLVRGSVNYQTQRRHLSVQESIVAYYRICPDAKMGKSFSTPKHMFSILVLHVYFVYMYIHLHIFPFILYARHPPFLFLH